MLTPWWGQSTSCAPTRASAPGRRPFTTGAKQALEDALREALALRHRHLGAEHILLALTARPGDDLALRLLGRLGVSGAEVRETLLRTLRATA